MSVIVFLLAMGPMASEDAQDLPFRIEQWDDADSRVEELIALVGDHRVAIIPSENPLLGSPLP